MPATNLSTVMPATSLSTVMPALVAGIHVLRLCNTKDVDGRNKSGHDESRDVDGTASRACPTCELNDEAQVG
jgi:hypothetical protein